ncbi:hypothetical protein F5Y05DRAFT_382661 [Hypoxylon sp. FL0543]|nr:hypothetical protein F5Y05DRAFT_382661 [Hypoxylon sp. FL0543]
MEFHVSSCANSRQHGRFEIMRKGSSGTCGVSRAMTTLGCVYWGAGVDDYDVVDLLVSPVLVGCTR